MREPEEGPLTLQSWFFPPSGSRKTPITCGAHTGGLRIAKGILSLPAAQAPDTTSHVSPMLVARHWRESLQSHVACWVTEKKLTVCGY